MRDLLFKRGAVDYQYKLLAPESDSHGVLSQGQTERSLFDQRSIMSSILGPPFLKKKSSVYYMVLDCSLW